MSKRRTIWMMVLGVCLAGPLAADWLVTRDGQRIETRGAWQVKGKMVVFTDIRGTLMSLRVDDLDLDASRAATEETGRATEPSEGDGEETKEVEPVLTLTNEDVGSVSGGASGVDLLIARLREAHTRGDRAALMRLVRWQGVSPEVRQAYEATIDYLLEHDIASVRSTEPDPSELQPQEIEGVTYRTNLPVRAKLEISLTLREQERADGATQASTSFLVGESLGVWVIVAATARL